MRIVPALDAARREQAEKDAQIADNCAGFPSYGRASGGFTAQYIAQAIRQVVRAAATRDDIRVVVDIVD